jgi:hypothetical protein
MAQSRMDSGLMTIMLSDGMIFQMSFSHRPHIYIYGK